MSGIFYLGVSFCLLLATWTLWRARLFREVPRDVKVMWSVWILMFVFLSLTIGTVLLRRSLFPEASGIE